MPVSPSHLQRRFEALLRENQRIVFHVARIYAGGTDERHDLAQEICAQLWRAFPGYDAQRRFSTWMYRIALNVGISHLRQHSSRVRHIEPLTDELAATIEDPRVEPDARMHELDQLIAALEPLDRALVLLYLDERPHAEIADILGISQTNVATKIGRIKHRLRKQMTGSEHPMERIDGTR